MEVHGWNGHLHCLKLWRWPCVVLVMSQRCFVKFMKSVRQEAGMWTTSSFEETTGISTTLCHWHFLRGKGTKIQRLQESANFIKFIPLLLPWNLSSKSLQIHPAGKSPFPRIVYGELSTLRCPLPRHESGAVALEIAPLFNCMHFSGRNHGETERSERSERLFCPLKKHHIPITFPSATLPGEREQFPPVKEARALRRPPRCFGAGHAFAELPALSFGSHHELPMWPEKASNGYKLHLLRLLLQLLQCYRFNDIQFRPHD